MLEIGSVVDGKYKILNKIGQGGMSIVYLAMNERANKPWAIKEVRKDGVSNYEVVKQNLIAETDILKRLDHPNLPSIIDVIDCEDTFLIVMDYIEGRPLSEALKREGAQPQEKVIEWAKQICDVLGYLHSRKPPIIYRDMKPSNVMLRPDGNIMIIDFGTAREYKSASIADTTCLGTQGYAAPEQFGGHGQTDGRTDIYCLGATLYHLLTGHNPCLPPYEMYPIRQWNPNLSSGLEEIILKCTQKNPDDRYQSCAELMYALEHYDELDQEYKKVQNRKWKIFLTTSILTVVSLTASVGFKFAETSTTGKSYDNYMKNAATAITIEEKARNYANAIKLNPKESEGYIKLLDEFKNNKESDGSQGNFTQEEAEKMKEILGYTGNGNKSNEDYLETNEEGYDEFAYDMAMAYYFFYEEKGNKQMSQKWFEIAAESESLEAYKVENSRILCKIAEYYASLNVEDKTGESVVSYRDYWNDMMELVSGKNLVSQNNNPTMALAMYEDFVYQVYQYTKDFKKVGITQAELKNELDSVQGFVETYIEDDGDEIGEKKKEVLKRIEQAKDAVSKEFSEKAFDTDNKSGGKKDAEAGNDD